MIATSRAERTRARASSTQRAPILRSASPKQGPALEAEVGAKEAGRDAERVERRLEDEGPGAAHRIDERPLGPPAGGEDDRRGQGLAERSRAGVGAVAALVEAPSGEVDPDGGVAFGHVDVAQGVGPDAIDVRPDAVRVPGTRSTTASFTFWARKGACASGGGALVVARTAKVLSGRTNCSHGAVRAPA